MFSGRLSQAIADSRKAVRLLEKTAESEWTDFVCQVLGYSCYFSGDFTGALEAAALTYSQGEATGDRRCQTTAAQVSGRTLTAQGEWEAGIAACQHALVCSPDTYETAITLGFLGQAYLEKGERAEALPVLEQAVEQATQYRSRQVQSWFRTYLGEAYPADGHIEKAHDVARQAFTLAQDIQHPWGAAPAQRTLGRIAHSSGNFSEAETHLHKALNTSSTIQARYELARAQLDLASLARTQENPDTATTHLSTAHAWFKKLQVPKWVEKTEQLAREYDVTLVEVELEELTEGSS